MAAPNSYTLILRAAPIPSADVERVVGTKKNNDVPPGPTNLGTLPAIATAAPPVYVEGKQVGLSATLGGSLRTAVVFPSSVVADQGLKTADPANAWPVTLYDHLGNKVIVSNGQLVAPTDKAFLVAGTDGVKDFIVRVDANGTVRVQEFQAPLAVVTPVSGSAVVVTLAAANASRKGLSVYNDTNKVLFLKFGVGATSASYTAQVPTGTLYEMPFPMFTGQVTGIWSIGVAGNALVTEST